MSFRTRQLRQGEELLLDARPHGLVLGRPVAVTVVVLLGAVAAAVHGVATAVGWGVVGVLAASLLWLLVSYGRWASTALVLTSERLLGRRGLLGRAAWEVPLDRLSEVRARQGVAGRIVGIGHLEWECFGGDGADRLSGVARPDAVRARIDEQLDLRRRRAGAAVSIPEQIRQLAELAERGVVTRGEFEAKKAQLLDRL